MPGVVRAAPFALLSGRPVVPQPFSRIRNGNSQRQKSVHAVALHVHSFPAARHLAWIAWRFGGRPQPPHMHKAVGIRSAPVVKIR